MLGLVRLLGCQARSAGNNAEEDKMLTFVSFCKGKQHLMVALNMLSIGIMITWTILWSYVIKMNVNQRLENFRCQCDPPPTQLTTSGLQTISTSNIPGKRHDNLLNDSKFSDKLVENIRLNSRYEGLSHSKSSSSEVLPSQLPINELGNNSASPFSIRLDKKDFSQLNLKRFVRERRNTETHLPAKKLSQHRKKNKRQRRRQNRKKRQAAVAHFVAPENFAIQYESGPLVSFNASRGNDVVYRFWRVADTIDTKEFEKSFHLDQFGHVTVKKDGYYLVYAQLVYHDLSGRWSFGIYVGDTERLKCLITEQLEDATHYDKQSHGVYHQCYTSQVMYIRKYQTVSIRCMYGSRTILTKQEFSFWGMVRL